MNIDHIENFAAERMNEVQEELGYEFTEEELAYQKEMIAKVAGFYIQKDEDKRNKRKIKAARRSANKVARQSRRTNRK